MAYAIGCILGHLAGGSASLEAQFFAINATQVANSELFPTVGAAPFFMLFFRFLD
jgi:hypothetical protein